MHPNLTGWSPRSLAQQQALACTADLLLFGGAAGSLKSETMLVDALAERGHARYRAILFRRSFPELEKSLIRRSRELYAGAGGTYNEAKRRWTFPSGAVIEFGYCESEKDIYRYQGAEYSFIGFDESTHFTEFPIRYILSRLRSVDPALNLRVRLASNPGNVGHATHKQIFLGPTCPHCQPVPQSRVAGQIYTDAVWPSDQHAIGRSTCFIPGRVTDHSLLGSDYVRNLESLGGSFRRALLEGCWNVYEGQYFDNWDPQRMVIPRALIPVQPWWPHWVGIDYGFNVSQAAAYLLCKSPPLPDCPAGRTYVLEEYTAAHRTAADFAADLKERFHGYHRIAAWYLSPDSWSTRGGGHSLADQMTEATGIGFQPADTDRLGGAMLIYSQLGRGELQIAESCRQLRDALATRVHDPRRPDDILKIAGEPLDDCIDALRYALYSYFMPARTPAGAQIERFVTSPDATVSMIQRRLAEQRWQNQAPDQPHTYLRGPSRPGRPRR